MATIIPHDVRDFILANIDSITQLEALLFLRNNAQHKWKCSLVAERMYVTQQQASLVLAKLVVRGFVAAEGAGEEEQFFYDPKNEDVALAIEQMANVYARCLVPVTNLIHQKARRDIMDLADAFKLKREK